MRTFCKVAFIATSLLWATTVNAQLHTAPNCSSSGSTGALEWATAPSGSSEFDWAPDGTLSNTFNNVTGTGVTIDMAFTGETGTFGTWGTDPTPSLGLNATEIPTLELFTGGFTTGMVLTLDFSTVVSEVAFDLYNVNAVLPNNGDLFTITGTNSLGQTVFPTLTSSATPSYTVDAFGNIDATSSSTAGDDDEVGINLADPNGLVSFSISWQNCTGCGNGFIHGLGIGDIEFCIPDRDEDELQDELDIDDDNDGIPDLVETGGLDPLADLDGDGVFAYLDDDDTDPAVFNDDSSVEATFDFDGDNVANHFDLDSDNDGIPDIFEAGGIDINTDGEVDYPTPGDPATMIDTDNDGLSDTYDSSVGGLTTITEAGDCSGTTVNYNHNILMSPGTQDILSDVTFTFCLNGDYGGGIGINEGITVTAEDGTNLGTYFKEDSDNPAYADCGATSFCVTITLTQAQWNTWNNNGTVGFTFTPTTAVNFCTDYSCLENVSAQYLISAGGTAIPLTNTDNNSNPDYLDLDSDDDGLADITEYYSGITTNDLGGGSILDGMWGRISITDANSNGWDDNAQGITAPADFDGDGVWDHLDSDADNDGIRDLFEGTCSTCPSFGVSTSTDTDGDGFNDQFENLSGANMAAGTNQGVNPNFDNNDGDDAPDYIDLDTDSDGAFDWSEGYDTSGDGNATPELPDYAIAYVLAGGPPTDYPSTDTDNDALPVFMDNQPATYGYIEANRPPFLDPNSIYYHDVDGDGLVDLLDDDINGNAWGTTAPIPDFDGVNDRDWRDVFTSVPLPVELIAFDAELIEDEVLISWITASEINNDYFKVQRSVDTQQWETLEEVKGTGTTSTTTYYSTWDKQPLNGTSYYRIVQVDFDGTSAASENRSIDIVSSTISIYPNPTSDWFVISGLDLELKTISAINELGQQVPLKGQMSKNSIRCNVSHLAQGTYTIFINGEVVPNSRLVIIH